MFKLVRFLKKYKKEVFLGPIFKLIEAIFELIVPLVMAKIIDVGIKNSDIGYILKMGGIMVLLGITGLASSLTCQYFAAKASQGFGTVVRNELFKHINSLSHSEIDKLGTPTLITRITNDVNQLQVGVAMFIRLAVRAPFLIIGSTVLAMILDLKLSCIFLIAAPLIALVLYIVMSKSVPFYRTIQKKLDRISLITRENLSGVRVIRAFSKQEEEKARFDAASGDLQKTSISVGKISALLNPLTTVIVNIAILAIIWFGGWRVYDGALSQGEIIALVNYMTQIMLTLVVVANLVIIFTKASASAARVNEIFEIKPSITDNNTQFSEPKEKSNPKVEFRNVYFSYHNNNEYSLSDINVKVYKGETVGIIGGTGSGKSTLVNMIPRFYDASKGEILVDGINVREYPLEQLRLKIGIVPQKAVLFSDTLRGNLSWGNEKLTDEQIKKALDISQASEFADKLPDGYDTVILQGGKNLSGGQKQRLTIARALVREPEILILDDSSSALDFATDAALRKSIKENTGDMTVFIVSQRVNTVKASDKIIVLDDGEVAGIGTHTDLFKSCEIYKEICLSQLSEEEVAK